MNERIHSKTDGKDDKLLSFQDQEKDRKNVPMEEKMRKALTGNPQKGVKDIYERNFSAKSKNRERDKINEQKLDDETDYRGIAGSGSLNATRKEIELQDNNDEEKNRNAQNPLVRGI